MTYRTREIKGGVLHEPVEPSPYRHGRPHDERTAWDHDDEFWSDTSDRATIKGILLLVAVASLSLWFVWWWWR